MSATCSITVSLEQYPVADDVIEWFGNSSNVQVSRGAGGTFTAVPSGATLGGVMDGS
jgi:hypothetical protein